MRKIILILIVVVGIIFIAAQFFRPDKNVGEITSAHLFQQEEVPAEVETILTNACLDCHSNTTHYLWYHHVVPVAWLINDHIIEGKEELNLSEWGDFSIYKKVDVLEEMYEEVEEGHMPLKSYTAMHPKARLSDEEKELLREWTEKLSQEKIASVEEN